MPLHADGLAPYAPAATVLSVIERARTRGLPSPITKDVLLRAGISESLVPRTLQSLQLLELITEDGTWTESFLILRRVPESEFQARLADTVRGVYEDVFKFVDPTKDNVTAIRDAFRGYVPHGQQERMVTLFLGLCQKAGIINSELPQRTMQRERRPANKSLPSIRQPKYGSFSAEKQAQGHKELPAPLAGLLATLPYEGNGWTRESRDSFHVTFGVLLDYCFPIREQDSENEGSLA